MSIWNEICKNIGGRRMLLAALLGVALAVLLTASAGAVVLNLQTARHRARSDTYVRCTLYAQHNYPQVEFASLGSCFGISVSPCKFTILSAKKAKCWTEFHTHNFLTGREHWLCTQMLYFRLARHKKPKPKYDQNDMFIYARSRQVCDNLDKPQPS